MFSSSFILTLLPTFSDRESDFFSFLFLITCQVCLFDYSFFFFFFCNFLFFMMTTNSFASDYHQNRNRHNRWKDLSSVVSDNTGRTTHRTRNGPYNIIEKDFGDHKVLYYVPSSYGSDYDLSQLDEKQPRYYSPTRVRRRRYYRSVDNDDDDSILSSRRDMYLSPRRPPVIQRIYYDRTPRSRIVDYIYAHDLQAKKRRTHRIYCSRSYSKKTSKIVNSIFIGMNFSSST